MTTSGTSKPPGIVYLVGAGPGDPGLVTLRAVECLGRADVVIYDYLVNPVLVRHAGPAAELVCLGRPTTGRTLSQAEINQRMVEAARNGRIVVRLKGGDPSVFGRGIDETGALRAAGIPFEVVPGITAGLAVGAYCEIPITHHEDASAIALITGRERDEKGESAIDHAALARFPGTLVFYMGVDKVTEWSQGLIGHGKPPETPVAVVRWCTRAQQQEIRCTLGTVANTVRDHGLRPPALFVVGKAGDRAPERSWFTERPLFGQRILVPGSQTTSEKLRHTLAELGADPITQPVIRINDPADWAPVDEALDRLERYDWLVFSSGNGVDYLLKRIAYRGGDVRWLGRIKLAAMGSGTAERLARYHLKADLIPAQFVAESLASTLVADAERKRFLLARASRGREVLAKELRQAGGHVDQIVVYDSVDVKEPDPEVAAQLAAGEIHWITVTSSAMARSLVNLYGDDLGSARIASIGPVTSSALREMGHEPSVEAMPQSIEGLVEAILGLTNSD
jgi:uroporphyrinogen III methyltransferase/synthase